MRTTFEHRPANARPTLCAALLFLALPAVGPSQEYVSPSEMDAAKLYGFSCADCHGAGGGGLTPGSAFYESFESPPADFTDPLFNSREPAADWALVITNGGASIGLSDEMPAFGDAFSDEQVEALVRHLKTFAATDPYPPGDLNFRRGIDTIKAFPEDEALLINRFTDGKEGADDSLRTTIYYGRRIGARHQAEVKVSQVSSGGVNELDEAEIGWKWAIRDNLEAQSLYSLGIEAAFPIDDNDASDEIIPYFSFAKGLSDQFTFQGMMKSTIPVDDTGDGNVKISGIVHWTPSPWPRSLMPALEATLTTPFSSGKTHATVIPQLYAGLSRLGHVAVAVGVEIPLTDLDYGYRIRSFLLWDIADGPFWGGW
jgi:mono/diheme cytochrome c family protein